MHIGMLWGDFDPKSTVLEKADKAGSYYQKKYGKFPNLCFVHPSMVEKTDQKLLTDAGIEIRVNRSILPNHFWIGCEE